MSTTPATGWEHTVEERNCTKLEARCMEGSWKKPISPWWRVAPRWVTMMTTTYLSWSRPRPLPPQGERGLDCDEGLRIETTKTTKTTLLVTRRLERLYVLLASLASLIRRGLLVPELSSMRVSANLTSRRLVFFGGLGARRCVVRPDPHTHQRVIMGGGSGSSSVVNPVRPLALAWNLVSWE